MVGACHKKEQKKSRKSSEGRGGALCQQNTAVIEELHQAIVEQRNMEELEGLLWAGVLAYQGKAFYTPFRVGIFLYGKA